MGNDLESLARSLINDCGPQGEKVAANFDKYAKILSSPEGKKLITNLTSDGGEELKKAASNLKSGDMSAAKSILSAVMSSREGADLVSKIIDASKK